ncbi:MAG: hypothetical protein KIS96_13375, partial [Bauldia sp.]|nr:hypothetical protein [Bauldia sp.]
AAEGQNGSPQRQQPKAAPRPQAPAGAPPAASGNGKEGWMSDLLRRASSDEAPGRPAAAPQANGAKPAANGEGKTSQALKALSADIAKAIDHQASIDAWDRFRRGERNAFTRRLYTLQGQQTFDQIRKRYQKNGEFKDAVDRYVSDFERLLGEVTGNGKDKAAGNAYLVSDTGKVYTLLAHASGRFD